jgi:hypothetical protein
MTRERGLRRLRFNILLTLMLAITSAAHAQQAVVAVPSNRIPLAFGMDAEQASSALGVPLVYVRGRPGNELLLALPNVKGTTLSYRSDGLYLQFRRGRLTGWKGDWGTIRP